MNLDLVGESFDHPAEIAYVMAAIEKSDDLLLEPVQQGVDQGWRHVES
jgi:hypothetical protein